MKRTIILLISIISCLLIGFAASKIQAESLLTWYPTLNKSPLTPSGNVFFIVWIILYVFMGMSIGYIVSRNNPHEMLFIRLFTIQILLNFLWSISFFYLQNPLLGFINIVLLALVLAVYLVNAYKKANKFSFSLFIPYLIWVIFAGYLNLYIVIYN